MDTKRESLSLPLLFAKLLMPDFCVSCKTLLELSPDPATVLCDECLKTWLSLVNGACPACEQTIDQCVCPVSANRKGSVDRYVYLASYGEPITAAIAYTLKRGRIAALEHFIARELAKRVIRTVGKNRTDVLLTYPPRSSKAKTEYGYDQMKNVARKVSVLTGIPMRALFKNCKGKEQKNLDLIMRMENAEKTYRFCDDAAEVAGKRVIILDDVVTSGSTTVACGKFLKEANAAEVICISIFRKL